MLHDITHPQLHAALRVDRGIDARAPDEAQPSNAPKSPQDRPKAPERRPARGPGARSSDAEAVQFRREDTSLSQLYRATRAAEEGSRKEKVQALRQAVQNGTYRPNLVSVAERMLSHGEFDPF